MRHESRNAVLISCVAKCRKRDEEDGAAEAANSETVKQLLG